MDRRRIRSAVRLAFVLGLSLSTLNAQGPVRKQRASPQTPTVSRPDQFATMATAIGDDYFDGTSSVARIRRHMQVAHALGVRYLRCAFSWNGIEPQRGQYRFEFWDKLVDEANRSGITLIPYVAYTPEWAAVSKNEFWQQPPKHPADFANFMRVLATRYRGKITHWELWNEPDNHAYWEGSPDLFATMIICAAKAVREAAPDDILVLGGMTKPLGDFFNILVSKYHLERYVDVLALHAYPESWNEERAETTFVPWIEHMHEVAERAGKQLWLNEMGYADYRYQQNHASIYGTNVYYLYEHTPRYQAEFLFKSFVMTRASGDVDLAGWYRIDDFRETDPRMPQDKVNDHLGIVDVNGKPKPAFLAYRFFNSLFSKPVRTILESPPNPASQAVLRIFQRKDGSVIVAGWLRSSNYSEVPAHSGVLVDRRREQINVPLPCVATRVSTFNVLGKKLSSSTRRRRMLRKVQLSGDHVYLAEIQCAKQ